jgi:DNA-binding transcriptional ArsR family regulator
MVKYKRGLDATFHALGDPTRRAILAALARGPASVTALARPHGMSLPAVMKHLRVLERAGLLSQRKAGRERRCRLQAKPLERAESWVSRYRVFWERQFDALDRYLAAEQAHIEKSKEDSPWPKRKQPRKLRSN